MRKLQIVCALLILCACSSRKNQSSSTLRLKGSESMHEVFGALKTDFETRQDSIRLTLEGGGSKTGLMAIKEHQADIGLSSFDFNLEEYFGADHDIHQQVVAYDAIVLITHQDNPLDSLTDEQIAGIYTGKINNWEQIGGIAGTIVPVVRDTNSGTQKFFLEHFSIENIPMTAKVAQDNSDMVAEVSSNINGIGYIGFAYYTGSVHDLKLESDSSGGLYEAPTHRNLENGKYPLKRGLRVYYHGDHNPATAAFLQYLKTREAQSIIESYGLIPSH